MCCVSFCVACRCYSHLVLVGTAVLIGISFSFEFPIIGLACQVIMMLCCAFGEKYPHLVLMDGFLKNSLGKKKGCFPEQLLDTFLILKTVCESHPPKGVVTFDRGLCSQTV